MSKSVPLPKAGTVISSPCACSNNSCHSVSITVMSLPVHSDLYLQLPCHDAEVGTGTVEHGFSGWNDVPRMQRAVDMDVQMMSKLRPSSTGHHANAGKVQPHNHADNKRYAKKSRRTMRLREKDNTNERRTSRADSGPNGSICGADWHIFSVPWKGSPNLRPCTSM